jgi:predicted Zn-dependent protease
MAAGHPPEHLVALQTRVDQIARDLFASPGWTSPAPVVRVDPRVAGGNRALASVHHGVGLIRISPVVADEPEEYLRGTLAHEAGHLALGHQRAAHAGWVLAIGIPLWALAIACCVIGVRDSTTEQTSLWFGLAFIPALLALRLIVIPSRRNELAADQWSTNLIGVEAVLSTIQHLRAAQSPLGRLAAGIGMDTHPSPRQRARHVQQSHL